MHFSYDAAVHSMFPELVSRTILIGNIGGNADVSAEIERFSDVARERLQKTPEGEWPEIQGWRRAFSKMGLKPTQYRCASESLLRRFRKEDSLPSIHPLIDLCNAVSLAFAIPIAVFDIEKISGDLKVRPSRGDEIYTAFSGDDETPEPGEIIFADSNNRAHARRWTNRQSGYSAVSPQTNDILIVTEAIHDNASEDTEKLITALKVAITRCWPAALVNPDTTARKQAINAG